VPVTQARNTWSRTEAVGTRGGGYPHLASDFGPKSVFILQRLSDFKYTQRSISRGKVQQECGKWN